MHQYKKTYLIMTCFQFQAWSIWFIFIRVEGNVFFPFFFPCFLASRKHQNTVGNFTEIPTCEKQKKKIVKTHAKESNHTHKTIFTWFSNLPTSTELQGFHYYQEKVQSVATDILTLKNTATPPLKTLITKVGLYIYKTGPKIFRPKPPLHGLSLSKSPIKNHAILFGSGRVVEPDQTKLGSTKPNKHIFTFIKIKNKKHTSFQKKCCCESVIDSIGNMSNACTHIHWSNKSNCSPTRDQNITDMEHL